MSGNNFRIPLACTLPLLHKDLSSLNELPRSESVSAGFCRILRDDSTALGGGFGLIVGYGEVEQ